MSIKEYLGLMGRPPVPAGGGDAWGQGIASGIQAFLASQPTLAEQQKLKMERDFYDARTGLVREQTRAAQTEAAIKAIEMMGKQRQEQAATALPTAVEQFVKNGAPLDGGYEGPTQPLPFPKLFNTGLEATGGDPQKAIRLLMGALGDRATPELAHSLQYAAGNMPGLDQAPTFATQRQYRDERAAQETAKQQAEIKKAQIGAQSRLDAAAIRGPSGGGASPWKIETVTGPDGTPIMMRVNPQTGQAEPFTGPGGTPLAGKRKDLTAPIQKTLGEYGDQYTALGALKANFKDEYAGQPMTGKAWNWVGRTFGDEGQAQFWQTSDALDMAVRNKMFGAALTAHEQRLWDAASIGPSMDPKQIRENVNRRIAILEGASRRRIAAYERNGFDRSQMEMLSGLTPVEGDPTAVNHPPQPDGPAAGSDPFKLGL